MKPVRHGALPGFLVWRPEKVFDLTNFHELGLSKQIVTTLSEMGYETATPIQAQAIPMLLQGRDMIGLAQTGTGKTAAFGLPLIEMLLKDQKRPDNRTTRTLILAPTRELVNQIAVNLKAYVRGTPLKINSVVGGASINKQQQMLEKGTDILVATPGRLLDLVSRRAIGLTTVRYLVLDEADRCWTSASFTICARFPGWFQPSARPCCSRLPCRRPLPISQATI